MRSVCVFLVFCTLLPSNPCGEGQSDNLANGRVQNSTNKTLHTFMAKSSVASADLPELTFSYSSISASMNSSGSALVGLGTLGELSFSIRAGDTKRAFLCSYSGGSEIGPNVIEGSEASVFCGN